MNVRLNVNVGGKTNILGVQLEDLSPLKLENVDDYYKLPLIFTTYGVHNIVMWYRVELNKYFDELILRIGGFKRNILLPRQVASKEQVIAKLDGRVLDICFEGVEDGSQKE